MSRYTLGISRWQGLGFPLGADDTVSVATADANVAAAQQKVQAIQSQIDESPCADCSLNAVTGFSGSNGSGVRKQYGFGQQWTNDDGDQSWFVPRGFYVELIEDNNFQQRSRRRITQAYSTNRHQIVNRPHHVFWLWIEDRRTPEEKARDAQVSTLQRELALAREEASYAAQVAERAAATAASLRTAESEVAAREAARSEIAQRQVEQQAAQEYQSEIAREQARQAAVAQIQQMQPRAPGIFGRPTTWIALGGAALLLVVVAARR